jgi:hypothetical protein
VARLDPSKWQVAATMTLCEITGSRAGSGGDPAVWHHHRLRRVAHSGVWLWGGVEATARESWSWGGSRDQRQC